MLLNRLQGHLESIYEVKSGYRVTDFLINDPGLARRSVTGALDRRRTYHGRWTSREARSSCAAGTAIAYRRPFASDSDVNAEAARASVSQTGRRDDDAQRSGRPADRVR